MSTMYECGACGLWKVAADFFRDVRYPESWVPRSICKTCMKAKRKASRVHWVAKVCTGCNQMVPISGYYIQAGSPHMPCKACRAKYSPIATVTVSEKQCVRCGESKPVSAFSRQAKHADGFESACRACRNAYRPKSIEIPAEKRCSVCKTIKAADDFYRTDKSRDGLYARCKDCHNQRAAPSQAKYRQLNQERVKQWYKTWETTNLSRRLELNRERRARELNAISTFTRDQWAALKTAYNNRCAYCGKPSKRLTIDHVIPLSKGGHDVVQNIVPACKPCNSAKKDREAPTHQRHLFG